MTAHARRREIGIMRLVGASSWHIQMPFVLEGLIAAVASAIAAPRPRGIHVVCGLRVFARHPGPHHDLGSMGGRVRCYGLTTLLALAARADPNTSYDTQVSRRVTKTTTVN